MGKEKKKEDTSSENIKVLVRMRPLSTRELDAGHRCAVELSGAENTVTVNHVCGAPDRWTFDAVINNAFSQKDIYGQFIQPLVESVLEGFNATVFAYGQSGSGKTHTMTGKLDMMGLIPRTFRNIFEVVRNNRESGKKFCIFCSFMEL